jgi:DNA-binding LacI/PurR family transcriptional regulator
VRLLGREPGRDLDIVGYDNCWSWCPQRAFVGSGLGATIEVDWTGIGRTLIGMLTARLAGRAGTTPVRSVVPARLVVPDERAG